MAFSYVREFEEYHGSFHASRCHLVFAKMTSCINSGAGPRPAVASQAAIFSSCRAQFQGGKRVQGTRAGQGPAPLFMQTRQ